MRLYKPLWAESLSRSSMLTRSEVAQMLGCKPGNLERLQEWCGLPEPRSLHTREASSGRVLSTLYWRAGDILVWANGTEEQLLRELQQEIGTGRKRRWREDLRKLIAMRNRAEEHGTKV